MTAIQNHYLTTFSPSKALVVINKGQIVTSSLTVAEVFEKLHKDVLKAIDGLDCSEDFNRRNFSPVDYQDKKGEWRRGFEITRDGFVFLVMAFTGKKAAAFKEMYIAEFNRMEDALRGPKKISRVMHGTAFKDDVRFLKAVVQLGTLAGLSKIQALLKANQATIKECGRDCLKVIGLSCLPVLNNEADFVPSDLGRKLGGISGRAVNDLLEKAGLQQSFRTHGGKLQWQPTPKGKSYAVLKETARQHAVGTCQQLFWKESVLDLLKK